MTCPKVTYRVTLKLIGPTMIVYRQKLESRHTSQQKTLARRAFYWLARPRGLFRTSLYSTPPGPASLRFAVQIRSRRICRTGTSMRSEVRIPAFRPIKSPRKEGFLLVGAPERIRTSDLRLRRPTLYPTELRAQIQIFKQG